MDFGAVGLEGLVGPEGDVAPSQVAPAAAPQESETKRMGSLGSGLGKQERSGSLQDDWADSKMARTDDFGASVTMSLHHRGGTGSSLLRSNSILSNDAAPHHQMLCFSSPKSDTSFLGKDGGLLDRAAKTTPFPYYQPTPASLYNRNAGFGSGSLNTSMHGAFSGVRGPFTPSQWIELEHQALIYKYITANVSVPSNLLIPIRKSFTPFGLSPSSSTSLAHNSLGWGSFHLGFSGNSDPEPGRCRRTDGKKWRCSRDAVADQKYCERHINRGRHRSRKPVEGQTGHAVSGPTSSKVVPMPSTMSASVMSSGGASNSLAIAQNQFKSLQSVAANPTADTLVSRLQEPQGHSAISPTINLKSRDPPFSISKLPIPFEESSQSEFGLVSSDSLLNPSERGSFINSRNYTPFLDFSDQESQDQHPFRQFIDDWPKDQSTRSGIAWPEELKSDWTQLSISIPMSSSDFSSSSSSPTHEKLAISPLRLSRELDAGQMGLGVSSNVSAPTQKQTSWIPISWGSSVGGPLGEVLSTSANNMGGTCKKNSSALNLMSEGWDGSPQIGSSPTGVLQKATFGSLSNSSSGSSPTTENQKTHERASHCEDMLGSTLATSSSIPSL